MNATVDHIIKIEGVSRSYSRKIALNNVTLRVPRGVVMGLVGANGAGKTTLIKHIMGLLRAQSGTVRVFGLDPTAEPVSVLSRLGYLSEDRDMPPWMTVSQLLRYSAAFRPAWDPQYAEELRQRFQLHPGALLRTLSKGELAKAGLIAALAHRPELLVLDEPSSGLDPIVRRELLEAVVRSVVEQGRTVLFSSHLLDEIGRVSDCVAMMAQGQLVLSGSLPEILETHRRFVVRFPETKPDLNALPGALEISGGPEEWTVISNGAAGDFLNNLKRMKGEVLEETTASFEEIFHARVHRPLTAPASKA